MKLFNRSEIEAQTFDFLDINPNGILEILGPTASGKTGLSIELAHLIYEKSGQTCEVISVDSRQVFRDCDISSAKVTTEEMQGIRHHGLDLVDLNEPFNVVRFQAYAYQTIKEIQARGNRVILCGGTGLWLDAVSENYQFSETPNAEGVFEKSNKKGTPLWPVFKIGLHWEREKLYERLNLRAEMQFEGGLIEETKTVLSKYPEMTRSAFTSFGYQEIKAYLDQEISREEALAINQKRNRNYAKRQLTWWRGREDVLWLKA